MKHTQILFSLLALLATQVFATDFKDNFTDPKLKERRAGRGDWKIADGIARCTQDAEIYKKNKDHGPILLYGGTASLRARIDSTLTVWMTPGLSKGDWDEVELDEIFTTRPAWGLPFPGQTDDTALLLFDDQENSPADVWTHRRLGEMAKDASETRLMGISGLSLAA